MKTKFYLPVLKSKQGEFDALSKLKDEIKRHVVPLFDITPMEWDFATKAKPRTIEVHLQNFCKKYLKKWPSSNAFIDTFLIHDKKAGDMTCIEYVFELIIEKGVKPVPVMRTNSTSDHINGINVISLMHGLPAVGLRITINDLITPKLEDSISDLFSKTGFKAESCHLILDLNDADFANIEDFTDGIVESLKDFPDFKKWKSFTICGGSFPATGLIKVGANQIPRNEWKFYNKLVEKLMVSNNYRAINYGDYSIVAPGYFEYDPTKMSRSANIRYSHNDFWYVIKGKALKKSEDYKQYVEQATQILKSKYYFGEVFSEGDLHIKKCTKGQTTPGSPTVWNWVGHNHHFTKVVSDLYASSLSV